MELDDNLSYILNSSDGFNPELLRLALNSSVLSVLVTDNRIYDNPIIYCNKAFEHVTGYRREDVIGLNCRFLQGKERDIENIIAIRKGLRNGTDVEVIIKNFRKDGTAFYNELHISPVRNSLGAITHFIGIQLDVTNRKENLEEPIPDIPAPHNRGLRGFLAALRLLLPLNKK